MATSSNHRKLPSDNSSKFPLFFVFIEYIDDGEAMFKALQLMQQCANYLQKIPQLQDQYIYVYSLINRITCI